MNRARAAAGAAALGIAALAVWTGASLCPFALVTGVPCPGCGLGRATIALLSGRPADAFRCHPLVFAALPALAAALASRTAWARPLLRRSDAARAERAVTAIAAALFVSFIAVWIARFDGAFGGPVPVRSLATLSVHG